LLGKLAAKSAVIALSWLLVALGAVLRVAQYAANRSLWLDEAALALNILQRDSRALLLPLDLHQAAPPGFLLLEKLASRLLGPSEWSLRLLPLLAGLAALFLFRRVAARVFAPPAALLAVALFALGDPLIYFASELKPYAVDVAVALLLLDLALSFPGPAGSLRARAAVALAIAGAAAVWISYPSVFVLAGIGSTLSVWAFRLRDRKRLAALLAVGVVWGASFLAVYRISLQAASASSYLLLYWAPNFLPLPPRSLSDLLWLPNRLGALFGDPVGFVFRGLGVLTFLVGCVTLFARNRGWLVLLLTPLLFALLGSGLHKYPFYGRLLLFLVPFLLLLVAEGAERIRCLTAPAAPSVGVILIGLLLFHPTAIALRFLVHPRTREEIRPVLASVREKAAPGDGLYVYGGAAPAFRYYANRYAFPPDRTSIGEWRRELNAYRQDLQALSGGGRRWFVFAHTQAQDGSDEEKPLLSMLDGIGRRLDAVRAPGASAYLYDLGGARP
jgi:hypothetical protein